MVISTLREAIDFSDNGNRDSSENNKDRQHSRAPESKEPYNVRQEQETKRIRGLAQYSWQKASIPPPGGQSLAEVLVFDWF